MVAIDGLAYSYSRWHRLDSSADADWIDAPDACTGDARVATLNHPAHATLTA
jgi:hypothetical protein